MKIIGTSLPDILECHLEKHEDDRGYFARGWSKSIAQHNNLVETIEDWSFSFNKARGTLRGLHWQKSPFAETKFVRCIQGSIWDVAVDLRPNSPTQNQWIGRELSAQKLNALYIPCGFAHGFITLTDNTLVQYGINGTYSPDHAAGARWDDPAFQIEWPLAPIVMNDRDHSYSFL